MPEGTVVPDSIDFSTVTLNAVLSECEPSPDGFGGCHYHQLISGPCTRATWCLNGTSLDADREASGFGVLAWALSEAHTQELLDALAGCRYYAGLNITPADERPNLLEEEPGPF